MNVSSNVLFVLPACHMCVVCTLLVYNLYFSIGAASEQFYRRQVELCGVTITLIGELLPSIRLLLTDSNITRRGVLAYYLSSTPLDRGIHG